MVQQALEAELAAALEKLSPIRTSEDRMAGASSGCALLTPVSNRQTCGTAAPSFGSVKRWSSLSAHSGCSYGGCKSKKREKMLPTRMLRMASIQL